MTNTDSKAEPASHTATDERPLKYQEARTLYECPGYLAVVQVLDENGKRLAAALRRDAIELHTEDDVKYLFDLEGRVLREETRSEYRFRGCSHQGSISRKGSRGLIRSRLNPEELEQFCRRAWTTACAFSTAVQVQAAIKRRHPDCDDSVDTVREMIQKVVDWTPERLEEEVKRFSRIYQPIPILPPDHYASLVVQATEGCSFNTCTFCNLYRNQPFRVRDAEAFDRHVRAVLAFHGAGLCRMDNIFLGQANALVTPQSRLETLLRTLNRYVELPDPDSSPRASWASEHPLRFIGIGSFLDGFTGLKKSAEDYDRLRRLGLRRTYLGVETGSDALLAWLKKPATTDDMLATLKLLHEAGIHNDVILLVGAGGDKWADEHVEQSLEFLARAPLERGDRIYLSDLISYQETPYPEALASIGARALTTDQMAEQRNRLRDGARELGLQAVPYRVEPFIY